MVKNLPFSVGDEGSVSDQGTKIPHVVGATKPLHHTKEPTCHNKDQTESNKVIN